MTSSHPVEGRPLLILGMHRSGTSLLAALLEDWGVHIGETLVGADVGNPRGHFEDRDILDFHTRALASRCDRDFRIFDDGSLLADGICFQATEEERREAMHLIAARRRGGYWGWKEPRTCLFLEFWEDVLPGLLGVGIYRHPLEVHWSHLRRATNLVLGLIPSAAMAAFATYNEAILKWSGRHPDRMLTLCANPVFADLDGLRQRLGEFLGAALRPSSGKVSFHAEEFRRLPITVGVDRLFSWVFPRQAEVFCQLQASSAAPWEPAPVSDVLREERCLALAGFLETSFAGLDPAARAQFLGVVEHALGEEWGREARQLHDSLRRAAARAYADYHDWTVSNRQELESALAEKTETCQRVWDEVQVLGEALSKEKANSADIWEQLVRTGTSWEHQRRAIDRLECELAEARQELARLQASRMGAGETGDGGGAERPEPAVRERPDGKRADSGISFP